MSRIVRTVDDIISVVWEDWSIGQCQRGSRESAYGKGSGVGE